MDLTDEVLLCPPRTTLLDVFESKIDSDILKEFKNTRSTWSGNTEYTALFNIWKSLLQDDKSYAQAPENSSTISNVNILSKFELECGGCFLEIELRICSQALEIIPDDSLHFDVDDVDPDVSIDTHIDIHS